MIKAVIFDFGGVFVDYGTFESVHLAAAKRLGLPENSVAPLIIKNSNKMQNGELTKSQLLSMISKKFGVTPKAWVNAFSRGMAESCRIKKELVAFAKRLRKAGYTVALCSNVGPMTADFNRTHGWYDCFSPLILSYEVKALKPQKKIYTFALRELEVKAKECVFIDDHEKCLVTARKLGMRTILFKNSRQIIRDLSKLLKF